MIIAACCWVVAILSSATLSWALPAASVAVNSTGISWHPSDDTQSTCGTSTFTESTNLDPADWRECASLYSSWTSQNGTFDLMNVDAAGFTPILRTKDCTLGVQPADASKGSFTIGDRDLKMLMNTSLRQFSEGTNLRVTGIVKCSAASGTTADVKWRISKS
ncbi:hypothetical protein E4U54_004001 [Claviceps lovelessii]|nr:hypothetical protein E4U54_004001 [Claviceps lovelessii]